MKSDLFDTYVEEAIDNIPEPFIDKIQNVVFKVEDKPTPGQREKLGLKCCDALFGLYEGVPLTERGGVEHSKVPDVITVFKYPMIHMHKSVLELRKHIYKTIWHEVAHYFGLDHDRIHAAERKL